MLGKRELFFKLAPVKACYLWGLRSIQNVLVDAEKSFLAGEQVYKSAKERMLWRTMIFPRSEVTRHIRQKECHMRRVIDNYVKQ